MLLWAPHYYIVNVLLKVSKPVTRGVSTRSLTRPIKEFVKRKLNKRGFYDIRGAGEITTVDDFKERAFAIQKRARRQTKEDVIALKKKYDIGRKAMERLLELQAQIMGTAEAALA